MIHNSRFSLPLILLSIFILVNCGTEENPTESTIRTDFGIFHLVNETTIEMDGVINSASLRDFNNLIALYPNISRIEIFEVDGSDDDETNLLLAKRVFDLGISTHLLDDGLIASGGVDFFLAGRNRTKGSNTLVGVHSWSDGTNEATDFEVGHEFHLPYIQYYVSVGFTQKAAEDFYYFTINAASADNIHWMTEAEIAQYGILKP